MPVRSQDTSRTQKDTPLQTRRPVAAKDIKTRYGENDELSLNTAREQTDPQEYSGEGVSGTQKYTVDKDSHR
jgi:hypothetical protein